MKFSILTTMLALFTLIIASAIPNPAPDAPKHHIPHPKNQELGNRSTLIKEDSIIKCSSGIFDIPLYENELRQQPDGGDRFQPRSAVPSLSTSTKISTVLSVTLLSLLATAGEFSTLTILTLLSISALIPFASSLPNDLTNANTNTNTKERELQILANDDLLFSTNDNKARHQPNCSDPLQPCSTSSSLTSTTKTSLSLFSTLLSILTMPSLLSSSTIPVLVINLLSIPFTSTSSTSILNPDPLPNTENKDTIPRQAQNEPCGASGSLPCNATTSFTSPANRNRNHNTNTNEIKNAIMALLGLLAYITISL